MDKLMSLLIYEAFLLVILTSLGGAWARGVLEFQKARRGGTIRTGLYGVGRTIHRSLDAAAFGRTMRRRVVELVLLLLAVIWIAALALVPAIGAFV